MLTGRQETIDTLCSPCTKVMETASNETAHLDLLTLLFQDPLQWILL